VVIASFSAYTTALSPGRRSIYTAVHFTVQRVLKSTSGAIPAGSTIDLLVAGGSLNLNGRLINYRENRGDDTPLEEGHRYLLFLRYSPESESYFIKKHWKLESGRVTAVDLLEKYRAKAGTSQFGGHAESEIIAATEEAIRSDPQ
jgi:hypothetical protein